MEIKKRHQLYKKLIIGIAAIICVVNPLRLQALNSSSNALTTNWQEFHSVVGKCAVHFPSQPEHVSEKMAMAEEGYELKYDAYISSLDPHTVFMLLIAQYPDYVDQSYAQMSLEGFLNGILTHNPGNQLISADLLLVNGCEALDFFIRTAGVYFKGRAVMKKNSLYLMAMECQVQNYNDGHFKGFVESFKFTDEEAPVKTKKASK